MRAAILVAYCLSLYAVAAWAADVPDYVARLKALTKSGTAHKNPELEAFLRSLTRDEMLVAAKQVAEKVGPGVDETAWEGTSWQVTLFLEYYGDEQGGLSDVWLDRLVQIIRNREESGFLRHGIVDDLVESHYPRLTDAQKETCRRAFMEVLEDAKSPSALRRKCAFELVSIYAEGYRGAIHSDPNVVDLTRSRPEARRDMLDIVSSRKIKLAPETLEKLSWWRGRIREVRQVLVKIRDSEEEPEHLKKGARMYLGWIERLPLIEALQTEAGKAKE
jgi:hypothetical protein